MTPEKKSDSFFHITPRERATFEGGIKLGGIFHQFTGTPVSMESAESLERAIEEAVRAQPFVEEVRIRINRELLEERCKKGTDEIGEGYTTLIGEMLDV
ncbi:MAG: dihydroneopterin aldolase, partial [Thermoplasmata archaeon]|nr:dihydroneopterin aldolase [Thermoplasmata archaeon]